MPDNEVTETLDAIHAAVEQDDFEALRELEQQLGNAIDGRRVDERVLLTQARTALSNDLADDTEAQQLEQLVQRAPTHNLSDIGILASTREFVLGTGGPSQDEYLETVSKKLDQERTFLSARSTANAVVADISLPATGSVVDISVDAQRLPKNAPTTVHTTVGNAGDGPLENVSLVYTAPEELSVATDRQSLRTLEENSQMTATVDVTGVADGESQFTVTLASDGDTVDTGTQDVTVVAKDSIVATALELAESLADLVSDVSQRGLRRSLTQKINSASEKIRAAQRAIGDGQLTQANEELSTAINILGAFLNQLHGGGQGTQRVDQALANVLQAEAEGLIDTLATAVEADP